MIIIVEKILKKKFFLIRRLQLNYPTVIADPI